MNQRRFRVFHLMAALITFFAAAFSGFFGALAVHPMFATKVSSSVPLFLFGLVFLGVSIFQIIVFLFATLGHYRILVDDLHLRIEARIGPFVRARKFDLTAIEAILVTDNSRGRPCVGILAPKPMRFGSLLRQRDIYEAVKWLQTSTGKTDGVEHVPAQ